MKTSKLLRCRKPECWINQLIKEDYVTFWPIGVKPESDKGYFAWTFHINWTNTSGTKANNKMICKDHHEDILYMFSNEAFYDRREQEVTEAWLVRTRSKM